MSVGSSASLILFVHSTSQDEERGTRFCTPKYLPREIRQKIFKLVFGGSFRSGNFRNPIDLHGTLRSEADYTSD